MKILFIVFLLLFVSLVACRKAPLTTSTSSETMTSLVRSDLGDFMPFGVGSTWTYVISTYDTTNGVPSLVPSTTVHTHLGGTVMNGKEYCDVDGALVHIKEGVYYKYLDDKNGASPIMIEAPTAGDTWQDTTLVDFHGAFPLTHTYTIIATGQQLTVPAGSFNDVVVLQLKTRGHTSSTNEWHYYQKGVGLLKQQINYQHYPKRVLMELQQYSIQ